MRVTNLCLFIVLLISACGGSSNNRGSETALANANITGLVIDAVDGTPLSGVAVSVENMSLSTTTNLDGGFELGPFQPSDKPNLRFAQNGYIEDSYSSVSLTSPISELEPTITELSNPVQLVPANGINNGSIGGNLSDDQGDLQIGALIRFLLGINVETGTAVATTNTNSLGNWNLSGLAPGNYTCIIEIDGRDPIYQTVQVIGGVDNVGSNLVLPASLPDQNTSQINYPADSSNTNYAPGDVTWSYDGLLYDYQARGGAYTADRSANTGSITLFDFGPSAETTPFGWEESTVTITHTFAGPGVYPVFGNRLRLSESAQSNPLTPAAFVSVLAKRNPTLGIRYQTAYRSISSDGPVGNITVSVDNEGRYRFDISGLNLLQSPGQSPLDIHPEAPSSISLSMSNGYVP